MDKQEQQRIQSVANIINQQPTNPVNNTNQSPRPNLDQRIQKMQAIAAQARVLGQKRRETQLPTPSTITTSQQIKTPNTNISHPTTTKEKTTLTTGGKPIQTTTLPTLQLPKKSKIPFMQKFRAYHANHQKPEYRKIASIPGEQSENKSVALYLFKDKDRAYKAAGEQGTNQYKYGGGRLVSYFNVVEKVPNRTKFTNEYQKQVWIHMLETVGTYNLYALLGKFDEEENILLHSANHSIDVYVNGLKGPIPMASKRSLQAFGLKERNRNLIVQTFEKRTIIVIESIIPWSEIKRIPLEMELCSTIEKAIVGQQGYGFKPQVNPELQQDIMFIAAKGCYDETIMQEHLVEVTIMDQQGNVILSTIVTPRVFVTINPQHLGFEEDDLTQGKDEMTTRVEIRKLIRNKTIITYNIKKIMRLCEIFTGTINGYIDLERHELLRRKCGIFTNNIKLPQMTKKFGIKTKYPTRTTQCCKIYQKLWKEIESETLEILQINNQYQEQDVLELQNQMEDEFTAIGRTPKQLPRDLIAGTSNTITQASNKEIPLLKNAFTINTSPMKRVRVITEEEQMPLLESIQKKCRVTDSTIPAICLINGETYQIQAIVATPIKNPDQPIICQTRPNGSQGREIIKGGRYVRDIQLQREDSERESSEEENS